MASSDPGGGGREQAGRELLEVHRPEDACSRAWLQPVWRLDLRAFSQLAEGTVAAAPVAATPGRAETGSVVAACVWGMSAPARANHSTRPGDRRSSMLRATTTCSIP